MSLTYLQKTVSARIDANGNATAILKPDVGQFWAPALVQVATGLTPLNGSAIISASGVLYRGGAGGVVNSTNYIDDTANASGDSSSIMCGTIVQYGEIITFVWANGTPNDVALMTIYGRSASTLVELQEELSPIPGTRFSGNASNLMVWNYNSSALAGPGDIRASPPTFTVPANVLVEIIGVKYTVTTNATVNTRFYGITVTVPGASGSGDLWNVFNSTPQGGTAVVGQPASSTVSYKFMVGINDYDIGGSPNRVVGMAIPPKMILPPGSVLASSQNNSANPTGDLWNTWQVIYRQYATVTKLGET